MGSQGPDSGAAVAAPEGPALRIEHLSKSFGGQPPALADVSLDVEAGQVHALLGHNGSGKSTLIKILSGFHEPDAGSGAVHVGGRKLRWGDSRDAHEAGIRFIHQDLGLVDELTVLENLRLGEPFETGPGWRIRWGRERAAAKVALERAGLSVSPDAYASSLGPVERTQLAVARALQDQGEVKVLVLDEPTAVLPNNQVERLFEIVRRTVTHGVGIVYVSHRLEEVFALADKVTVLRAGRVVGQGPVAEFDHDRLVRLIVGDSSPEGGSAELTAARASDHSEAMLAFKGVSGGELREASFEAGRGEVLGLAGLAGSGVHDVSKILLGRERCEAGTVEVESATVERLDANALLKRGVAVLPSERLLKIIAPFTVRENYTLPDLHSFWRAGRLRRGAELKATRSMIAAYSVVPGNPEQPIDELSGGNRQKVAVAKWLRCDPAVIVLDEPTQGVDIGAKMDILEVLRGIANDGVTVVVCSSDIYDLTLVCERVLVMRRGQVAAELTGDRLSPENIISESYQSEATNGA
jgi:ribose transport system ATP-binding protein